MGGRLPNGTSGEVYRATIVIRVQPEPRSAVVLSRIDAWPVNSAAAGLIHLNGRSERHGPTDKPFALASLTKPLFGLAVMVACEEGSLQLDAPAGPPGSTVRHLLSHASGLGPDKPEAIASPGTKRIYSNAGYETLGHVLEEATGMSAAQYFHEAVVLPLNLESTRLDGSPAYGAVASANDLLAVCSELFAPTLLASETIQEMTTGQFPELAGVLPGFGRQDPNLWGLGFELRGNKEPHWTSPLNSKFTYGHFGRAGTMFWIDPEAGLACVALTDREFGPWAVKAWPALSEAVLGKTSDSTLD